jgi:hypothetical protein
MTYNIFILIAFFFTQTSLADIKTIKVFCTSTKKLLPDTYHYSVFKHPYNNLYIISDEDSEKILENYDTTTYTYQLFAESLTTYSYIYNQTTFNKIRKEHEKNVALIKEIYFTNEELTALSSSHLNKKSLKHIVSLENLFLECNKPMTNINWYDKIYSLALSEQKTTNLYLGALPTIAENNIQQDFINKLKKENITAVLSIVEDFEFDPKFSLANFTGQNFGNHYWPISSKVLKHLNIEQKIIKTSDHMPVQLKDIITGVEFINQNLLKDKNVYVHCKVGRGRSATIIIAYLMKYNCLHYIQAMKHVKSIRTHINLNKEQLKALENYQIYLENEKLETSSNNDDDFIIIGK